MQQPTCTGLRVRSSSDAHLIFHAVFLKLLPMVTRRLDTEERRSISSGCIYVWEERGPNAEATGVCSKFTLSKFAANRATLARNRTLDGFHQMGAKPCERCRYPMFFHACLCLKRVTDPRSSSSITRRIRRQWIGNRRPIRIQCQLAPSILFSQTNRLNSQDFHIRYQEYTEKVLSNKHIQSSSKHREAGESGTSVSMIARLFNFLPECHRSRLLYTRFVGSPPNRGRSSPTCQSDSTER